ncbi:MAG: hypothetical protein WCA08_01345 [Desulfoferrobacter sp.]
MSIRLLAIELYRFMKRVEELEKEIETPSLSALSESQRDLLAMQLREARHERDRIKAILEGAKET